MTTIFLVDADADRACADEIRQGLVQAGYTVWRAPDYPTPREVSYPYLIESAIIGSAAVVLLWSAQAEADEWVERNTLFAGRLHKSVVLVTLDGTPPPNTLIAQATLPVQSACRDVAASLLPHLPAHESADPLLALCENAAHQHNARRKEAIEQAKAMLSRGDHRAELLPLLDYLAHHDLMNGVRERALAALNADTLPPQNTQSRPLFPPEDARFIMGITCPKGHITYYDRRRLCHDEVIAQRIVRAGLELDTRDLPCGTDGCGAVMHVPIDCRDC
jgi:hypothetical protein